MINGKICKRSVSSLILAGLFVVLFSGCMSVPKVVPEEWSKDELNQRAQEFIDRKNYPAAVFLYETLLERHPDDLSVRVSANFEIGHIYMKQNKWEDARVRMETVLNTYEENPGVGIPPEYRKLALIDVEAMKDK